MKNLTLFLLLLTSIISFSQEITGDELLKKAIQFHDPNGNWETFKGEFFVTMETPKNGDRVSKISINLPEQFFSVVATRDTIITEYILDKNVISFSLNGNKNPSEEIKKKFSLNYASSFISSI